jgi:hypothetical protein
MPLSWLTKHGFLTRPRKYPIPIDQNMYMNMIVQSINPPRTASESASASGSTIYFSSISLSSLSLSFIPLLLLILIVLISLLLITLANEDVLHSEYHHPTTPTQNLLGRPGHCNLQDLHRRSYARFTPTSTSTSTSTSTPILLPLLTQDQITGLIATIAVTYAEIMFRITTKMYQRGMLKRYGPLPSDRNMLSWV